METQLSLDLRARKWGGARAGAGRTRTRRHDPAHRPRPAHLARHPLHIVLRTRSDVPRLRKAPVFKALRRALLVIGARAAFRVVHISIQHNHLHLLVEAEDKLTLSRGMQAFAIAAAKAINFAHDRVGKVFAFRYHATAITHPRQARNSLAYVLNNWRRHKEDHGGVLQKRALVDPYSSGVTFGGWSSGAFRAPDYYVPLEVAPPQTWLLREGWKRYGAISPTEIPGPVE